MLSMVLVCVTPNPLYDHAVFVVQKMTSRQHSNESPSTCIRPQLRSAGASAKFSANTFVAYNNAEILPQQLPRPLILLYRAASRLGFTTNS